MSGARVVAPVGALQVAEYQVRVDRRREERAVAEQLLDVPDVGAALEHVRGTGVPERVDGYALRDARAARVQVHQHVQGGAVQRPAR